MACSDSSESCVKLMLTVGHHKGPREVIKGVTKKGNEVVEVNGFTFVRKRKLPDAAQQPAPSPKRHQAQAPEQASQQQQQQQAHPAPAVEQPAPVCDAAPAGSACEAGSMEADSQHPGGEGEGQVQVRLLPHPPSPAACAPGPVPHAGDAAAAGTQQGSQPLSSLDAAAQPEVPSAPPKAPTAEELCQQLATCLPAHCPSLVKLQFVVARALDAAAAQASTPASRTAHLLSQAFAGLLEQEVAACQQQLAASAAQLGSAQFPLVQAQDQQQQQQPHVDGSSAAAEDSTHAQQPQQQQQQQQQQGPDGAREHSREGQQPQTEKEGACGVQQEGSLGLSRLPPVLREAVMQASTLAASLRQQLSQLESEQASWLRMKHAYASRAHEPHSAPSDAAAAPGAAADAAGAAVSATPPVNGYGGRSGVAQSHGSGQGAVDTHMPAVGGDGDGHRGADGAAVGGNGPAVGGSCPAVSEGGAAVGQGLPTPLTHAPAHDQHIGGDTVRAAAAQPLPEEPQQQQQQQCSGVSEGMGAPSVPEAEKGGEAGGEGGKAVSELAEAKAQAGARNMMQVEVFASRLARMELLVSRAEQVANAMQADYHQDRFRTFPHVNSPAWLIRRITMAKPEQWQGANENAAPAVL